jgi:FkbM family methyltransferase
MDMELSLYRTIGRHLPPLPHATALVNRLLKPLYLRKRRDPVIAEAWGLRMKLNPREAVDAGILFYPQLFNRREFQWLEENLRPTDIFADVGANIGAFALRAARTAKAVVAIEANPSVFLTLQENIRMNEFNIQAVNKGVSDKRETLSLSVQSSGNLGGSSFVFQHGGETVDVECVPLFDIAPTIDVMKIDVEGMEFRVLQPYLSLCQPRVIMMEAAHNSEALELCLASGYRLAERSAENVLLI